MRIGRATIARSELAGVARGWQRLQVRLTNGGWHWAIISPDTIEIEVPTPDSAGNADRFALLQKECILFELKNI